MAGPVRYRKGDALDFVGTQHAGPGRGRLPPQVG